MLEPSADDIHDWGNSVTQFIIDYLGGLRDRPVYRHTSSRKIRSGLDSSLPIKGTNFDALLKTFRDTIVPFSRQNAHPRMFGYVQSPGTPIAAIADLSIFCFRHVPAQLRNESRKAIDTFNERLLVALQRDGSSYLSNATLGDRFALRGCVLNYRTTLRDMEILLDDLRRVAKSFLSST